MFLMNQLQVNCRHLFLYLSCFLGTVVKKSPANVGDAKDVDLILNWGYPLEEGTLVFLPAESHGQRSLVG